ncbi:MAG: esterase-like activity of phytase family protein [Pseudomonadales bacterium]
MWRSLSTHRPARLAAAALAVTLSAAGLPAQADKGGQPAATAGAFVHLGTFDVMAGNGSAVAEIVDVTVNGKQLVYTDADQGEIGFVDIRRPRMPVGEGTVALGGEPTSLAVLDPLVLVAVNTSESFTNPSGKLVVVHRNTRRIVAEHALPGQPDSVALAPDRKRAVIVIENERDEDRVVNGGEGLLPQPPTGALLVVDLRGAPQNWSILPVDLSPVAAAAFEGSDLEPEYVDVNDHNLAVVSFQENNHLAVVDIVKRQVISQFPAGSVVLNNVDTAEEDLIVLDSTIEKRREPDAVAWIDHETFATANEGDYEDGFGEEGGSRGFTVFRIDGSVVYESAESFEHALVRAGHYPEGRSENKGVEPESVEVGRFGKRNLLFVGSERGNAVGVFDVTKGQPALLQALPTGIGPEGLKAIPKRNLFVVSTETDVADIGVPTMINLYGLRDAKPRYPMIVSGDDAAGLPIPWVALSGLAADPHDPDLLYAVSDAFLAEGFIYTVDVSARPAVIIDRLTVTGASVGLDLEGIAVGPDGAFWLGSEGNAGSRPNRVLKVDAASGSVLAEIALPAALEAGRRSNGIEGIAVTGTPGNEMVYVVIQRAWLNGTGDTDQVNTKIGRYDVATGAWTFVHYPLEPQGGGDWIGLSELTLLPDGSFAVIERDKGWGPSTGFNAELKAIFQVDLAAADFRALDLAAPAAGLVTIDKTLLRDVLPVLARRSIWTAEKLEGFAVATDGRAYAVTDNDGIDDATGETVFLRFRTWDSR